MNESSRPELVVIAPCLNEQDNIELLVRRTLATFDSIPVDGKIVLVDDGSTDNTWNCIENAVQSDSRVHGERHRHNQGIVASWQTGLDSTSSRLVCLIDSDLQNRPEDIEKLYASYQSSNTDVVQAVRLPKGIHSRRFISRALSTLLNIVFQMKLRDNKSGFVLCERTVLRELLVRRYRYRFFQSFIGVAASIRGYVITEVDTDFEARHAGTSFLKSYPIAASCRTFIEIVKYRVETWRLSPARHKKHSKTTVTSNDVECSDRTR